MVRYIIGYVIFGNGTTLTLPSNGYIYIYIDEADKYKWQQNLRTQYMWIFWILSLLIIFI